MFTNEDVRKLVEARTHGERANEGARLAASVMIQFMVTGVPASAARKVADVVADFVGSWLSDDVIEDVGDLEEIEAAIVSELSDVFGKPSRFPSNDSISAVQALAAARTVIPTAVDTWLAEDESALDGDELQELFDFYIYLAGREGHSCRSSDGPRIVAELTSIMMIHAIYGYSIDAAE